MSTVRRLLPPIFALVGFAIPLCATAQGVRTPGSAPVGFDVAEWSTGAWSPFTAIADMPRTPLRAPAAPSLLTAPAPGVGLAWTGGDPSGLPTDVRAAWGSAAASGAGESGGYRRPLDAAQSRVVQGQLTGWQRLGTRGAAVGRIVVDQEGRDPSSPSHVISPYSTSPFVLLDSSETSMRLQRARLEGAGGWAVGEWALGIGVGIESRDTRSERTRVPRIARAAAPAVSAGVSRGLPWGGVRLAAFARWMGEAETSQIIPRTGTGTAYLVAGYTEPDRMQLTPNSFIERRQDRSAAAVGGGATGSLFGATWAVAAEATRRNEEYSSQRRDDPPSDRWEASGSRAVAGVQRRVIGERLLVTARGEFVSLEGEGRRADLTGIVFRAAESMWQADAEVRWQPVGSAWSAAASGTVRREERTRQDFVARRETVIDALAPGVSVEVARRVARRVDLSASLGIAQYEPTSRIPNASAEGPVYRAYVGPSIAYDASAATAQRGALTARYMIPQGGALWVSGRQERASVGSGMTTVRRPVGSREGWVVVVGVTRG